MSHARSPFAIDLLDAQPRPAQRLRCTRHLGPTLSIAVLACLCVGMSAGCAPFLEPSETTFIFPDGMLNADFAPPKVRPSSWDPFGWNARFSAGVAEPTLETGPSAGSKRPAAPPSGPLAALADGPSSDAFAEGAIADYVVAVYGVNGVQLGPRGQKRHAPTIVQLYEQSYRDGLLYHSEAPAAGDLVFFHNTYDRNRDGRFNDWYTLVGIVESVDGQGTVSALAYLDGRVRRLSLNVRHPDDAMLGGKPANTVLRAADQPSPAAATGTAARLFAGYANVLGNASKFTVIDNWQPGMAP